MLKNLIRLHGTSKEVNRLLHVGSRCMTTVETNNATEMPRLEKSINQVTLLGRVGNEPQKRGTEEHPVITFSIATHELYKYETGDYVQRTNWHRICVFRPKLRDTVYNYLRKGQRVLVNGRLSYGEVKDEDGQVRPTTAIIADDVIFFSPS
ncbi:single-stranded DNA-binding protein, mitochondrial isoform X2 [Orussus abietinus]|uniref:single-stranded DNA-binding protein, mitochondrial isoform X2 n=1 Tax=Orussus abietinus TaxID=222816 RepID=UPI000625ED3E|nr:single-stranded DNA-binding protein, mitochondrial isoform X2 [Orussus abietinus]